MFSSSHQNGSFESFGAQGRNPFGQNQGPMAMNPFQANCHAPAVKTTFGQNLDVNRQLPLPPGGKMGAPDAQFGRQPPGRLPKASTPLSCGEASTKEVSVEQASNSMIKTHNNSHTAFGSTRFEQNGVHPFTLSEGAHTTFGLPSNDNGKLTNQGFIGTTSASFNGLTPSFDKGFHGGQSAFSMANQGSNPLSYDSSGFHFGSSDTTPLSSPNTAFSYQKASGVHGRKKLVTSHPLSIKHADNPFASTIGDGGTTNKQTAHTSFGNGLGGTSSKPSSRFGQQPFISTTAVTTTALDYNRRQKSKLQFGGSKASALKSDKRTGPLDPRMANARTLPLGKSRLAKGVASEPKAKSVGGKKRGHLPGSSTFSVGGNEFDGSIAPNSSSVKEKPGKHRQSRQKKKASGTSDEETLLTPSVASLLNDESSKAKLSAATNLDGRCADMCSPAERELHMRVDELSVFERDFPNRPGTERDMIIKRFQRSSADHKLDLPGEIRPPGVLRRTQLYIEQAIMDLDQCGLDPRFQTPRVPEPIELYNFCWDRFRMIRKDFVLQNYRGAGGRVHPIVLDVHERIARFHVLSEHELIETPSFVAQQNMEQLGQTLKSLNELYDESHKVGNPAYLSPFEAECRAYFILCTLDNGRGMDVLKYVKNLPRQIMESGHLNFAMRAFVARHTGDYFQFFALLRQATYLQSCLLFRYIPNVRSSALLRMNRAYRGQAYPLEDLVEQICFDDIEHAYSVCQEHQLQLAGRPGAGNDSSILVKFGGDCATDVQLRRNNTPLKTRSSKLYVGMKQGNYLRRDICRGVTEYARNEYPALSKLIQDLEREEQARLYPEKPPYTDDYTFFVDFNQEALVPPPPGSAHAGLVSSQQPPTGLDYKLVELDAIAERKRDLEHKKMAMLERMRELEKAKEKKMQHEQAHNTAAKRAVHLEEQQKTEATVLAQAEKEAKLHQETLVAQLRDQARQQEVEKQRKEAAWQAERQRVAALQQADIVRQKAAIEERRRKEEKRREEAQQKAAKQCERRRQQEITEARAREALEAQRQARLAKELVERKRRRRLEKQRLAILNLRLQVWKKYVQVTRDGPGPVSLAAKLQLSQPHQKAKDSMQWLFRGSPGTSIGTKRRKQVSTIADTPVSFSTAELVSFWHAEDIVELVGSSLRRQNSGLPSIAWKLVIADLFENASSSFGLWCAVRAGAQDAWTPEHDCHRTYHSSCDAPQGISVCSRYLDWTFTLQNTHQRQQDKLAATSAILLPVDLSALQQAGNVTSWEDQVENLMSLLDTGCRVAILGVGFASVEIKATRAQLLSTLTRCIERVQHRFRAQVAHVSVELVDAGGFLPLKLSQVLKKIAELSPPIRHVKGVGLKELLEDNVKAAVNQFESSIRTQSSICTVFSRVRHDILSSGIMDFVYSPPELQCVVVDPPRGWNSKERRHEIQSVLTALEVTCIGVELSSVDRIQACDFYFKRLEDFIDRLFLSYGTAASVSTYELKKRIYYILLPIHEQWTRDGKTEQVTPQEADVLLPWRKMFEDIYYTFFETLSDEISIYYPTDWRGGSSLVNVVHRLTPKQALNPRRSIQRNCPDVKQQPVHVVRQRIHHTFGTLRAVSEYKTGGEIKRLRVEIEQERAATSQFQHMLRQALHRWNDLSGS